MTGKIIYSELTSFGEIQILDTTIHGVPARYLLVDGWQESAVYLDPGWSDRLIFPYMKDLDWPLSLIPPSANILLIGGGAFTWPRHVLVQNPAVSITVAELYPEIIRISEEFFGLKELEIRYGNRLTIFAGNGFDLLRRHKRAYDLIVNDAFTGKKRAGRALDDTILVHSRLSQNGIYAANVTSAVKGPGAVHLNCFMSTLSRVFTHTDAMICEPDRSPFESQNILAAASDAPLKVI